MGAKTYEDLSFLVDVIGLQPEGALVRRDGHLSRQLARACANSASMPSRAALLRAVIGLEMRKLEGNDVCCGFGGTFCVKYPAISNAIVEEKAAAIEQTGAELLLAGDLGCLMNMAGKLSRRGSRGALLPHHRGSGRHGRGPAIGEEG